MSNYIIQQLYNYSLLIKMWMISHPHKSSVTPAGLEPTTNRTGICHSIQLNYGAKGAKIEKMALLSKSGSDRLDYYSSGTGF